MRRTRVPVALVTLEMNLRNHLLQKRMEKHRLGRLGPRFLTSPRAHHMQRHRIPNNPQVLLWRQGLPVQVTPKRMKGRPILLRLWIPPQMQRPCSSRKASQPRKDMLKKRRLKVWRMRFPRVVGKRKLSNPIRVLKKQTVTLSASTMFLFLASSCWFGFFLLIFSEHKTMSKYTRGRAYIYIWKYKAP